jgi:hypothetical protein
VNLLSQELAADAWSWPLALVIAVGIVIAGAVAALVAAHPLRSLSPTLLLKE